MSSEGLADIRESIRRLEDKLDSYMVGEKGKANGILSRLTRLETVEEHQRWHVRALWAGVLAVLGKLVMDLLAKL